MPDSLHRGMMRHAVLLRGLGRTVTFFAPARLHRTPRGLGFFGILGDPSRSQGALVATNIAVHYLCRPWQQSIIESEQRRFIVQC